MIGCPGLAAGVPLGGVSEAMTRRLRVPCKGQSVSEHESATRCHVPEIRTRAKRQNPSPKP